MGTPWWFLRTSWDSPPHGRQELRRALLLSLGCFLHPRGLHALWPALPLLAVGRDEKSQPVPWVSSCASTLSCYLHALSTGGQPFPAFSCVLRCLVPTCRLEATQEGPLSSWQTWGRLLNANPRSQWVTASTHMQLRSIFRAMWWSHWQKLSWITGAAGRGRPRLWNQLMLSSYNDVDIKQINNGNLAYALHSLCPSWPTSVLLVLMALLGSHCFWGVSAWACAP